MTRHIPGKLWVAVMTLILVAQHPSVGGRAGGTDAHGQRDAPRDLHVHWFAPFWSGGGYSSEAIAFAEALYGRIQRFKISQHGDSVNEAFVHGVPKKVSRTTLQCVHCVVLCCAVCVTVCFVLCVNVSPLGHACLRLGVGLHGCTTQPDVSH